ncbi:MAG: TolC family protein [Deltaproteobacteria bacterium]|nr:TolC family protein [Deltaproteobacteria bacterium]
MNFKYFYVLIAINLFFLSSSFSQLQDSVLQLDDIVSHILKSNPEYIKVQNEIQSLKQKSRYVSSWDDPTVGVKFDDIPTGQFIMQANRKIWFVMQTFPFPGKLTLQGKIVDKDRRVKTEELSKLKLSLLEKAKKTYYQLYFTNKSIEIGEENSSLLRKFQSIASSKYSVGKASQQDILKAMVEESRITNDLITLAQVKETLRAKLNTLMNREPSSPLGEPPEPKDVSFTYSLVDLQNIAMTDQQSLRSSELNIKKEKEQKLLSQLSYLPDFFTRFEYLENETRQDMWAAEIGITIPFWFWHKQVPEVKEKTANIMAQTANHRHLQNETLFMIKDAYVRLGTAKRLWNLYESSLLTQARQALKSAESGYKADRVDFLNLIESYRILESFRLEYHRSISDYFIAKTELETVVGKELN